MGVTFQRWRKVRRDAKTRYLYINQIHYRNLKYQEPNENETK